MGRLQWLSGPHKGINLIAFGWDAQALPTRLYGYLPKPLFGGPGPRTLMRA